ncbi:MAG: TatD family deoxyribonuclease [Firmicutes bacterium]|nr:TatD family deoxyribonuclease [Bacillota bacterium]
MILYFIDTHAHLDFSNYDHDRDEVIKRAHDEGVSHIINIGADLESSQRSVELADRDSSIYAAIGIHPHEAAGVDKQSIEQLKKLATHKKVLAIGEIGLDYHYDNSPRETQQEVFRKQLKLAHELSLPVVIHNREADRDCLSILKDEGVEQLGGIMHCFNSSLDFAWQILDLNLYIAFGGVITFKNAGDLRDVVKSLPVDKIVIETDSPYLTPHPCRGKRNEPAYVKLVLEKIAEIKDIPAAELARITSDNAKKAYRF